MEELSDLFGERRSARNSDPQPAAEALLDLRVDEPVGEPMLERQSPRQPFSLLA